MITQNWRMKPRTNSKLDVQKRTHGLLTLLQIEGEAGGGSPARSRQPSEEAALRRCDAGGAAPGPQVRHGRRRTCNALARMWRNGGGPPARSGGAASPRMRRCGAELVTGVGAYQCHHRETAMTPADANWGGSNLMNHE